MKNLRLRDLARIFAWLFFYLLFLSPFFLTYWLIGYTQVFEVTWLWSLAGVAALLVLARERGHGTLVLGLCCLTFWFKVEPFLGLYLFCVSVLLFTLLHLAFPRRRQLFWICLSFLVVIVPKCLPLFFAAKPQFWLWLRESLLLGFFLRCLCYERAFAEGKLGGQRFFEHLAYLFFIPQLFKLLNLEPEQTGNRQPAPTQWQNLWSASRMFLLGSAKFLAYQSHLLIPLGLQEGGAGSFLSAWYQIFTHYLLWFLWLSAHYDYAVALARLLGVYVPANFHFPLLATSPVVFWQRWHVLHHRFLKKWIYRPAGGKNRPGFSIPVTFLVSAILFSSFWIGSSRWWPSPSFFSSWLPFFVLQALLVYGQIRLGFRAPAAFFPRICGWFFTQTTFALCSLFLAGLSRFPKDTVLPATVWAVLRRAFFAS